MGVFLHSPHSSSLCRFGFPPSVLPSASGSQFIQTRQVAQSLWEWSLASSRTGSSRPPALSARGASTPSRGTPSLPGWISRGRRMPGRLPTATARSGSRWAERQNVLTGEMTFEASRVFWSTVFFVPPQGRSGEDKAPHRHHHSGGQGLRSGAVCVGV